MNYINVMYYVFVQIGLAQKYSPALVQLQLMSLQHKTDFLNIFGLFDSFTSFWRFLASLEIRNIQKVAFKYLVFFIDYMVIYDTGFLWASGMLASW